MHLLHLPQELLDLIAAQLDAFDYPAVRHTNKHLYHVLGGDDALRRALIALEKHWAGETHVMAVLLREPHKQPELFPSYRHFLRRAPCYTCLRISGPHDTLYHTHHGRQPNVAMLPWNGLGGFDAMQLDEVDVARKCIPCIMQANRPAGNQGTFHLSMAETYVFACKGCECRARTPSSPKLMRQLVANLCTNCFEAANAEWLKFKARLEVRVQRLQRYVGWSSNAYRHRSAMIGVGRGPLPPRNDVREDWSLWHSILDNAQGNSLDIHFIGRLNQALGMMSSYQTWMSSTDQLAITCPHRRLPPNMDGLGDLGPWPSWSSVVAEVAAICPDSGKAPCGPYCRGDEQRRCQMVRNEGSTLVASDQVMASSTIEPVQS